MFEKREIFGIDKQNVIDLFVKKVIISENMVKYTFPSNWSEKTQKYVENPIGFNKTIIKFQLGYFIKEVYDKNLTEVSNIKNSYKNYNNALNDVPMPLSPLEVERSISDASKYKYSNKIDEEEIL